MICLPEIQLLIQPLRQSFHKSILWLNRAIQMSIQRHVQVEIDQGKCKMKLWQPF